MLVVMPLGYGAPEIVARLPAGLRDPESRQRNFDQFPRRPVHGSHSAGREGPIASNKDRNSRAIAGLSMGGAESLLHRPERAGSALPGSALSAREVSPTISTTNFRHSTPRPISNFDLLWIACGTDDRLIEPNRKFREWLKSKGIKLRRHRNSGHAHLDGLAPQSGRFRSVAVSGQDHVAPHRSAAVGQPVSPAVSGALGSRKPKGQQDRLSYFTHDGITYA